MEKLDRPYVVMGVKLVYQMPKEVDHHVAKDMCQELDMLVEAHRIKELVLDFAATEFMDSSGIGVVIGRSKKMRFYGGVLAAMHVGKRVDTIFRSAGLYKIIHVIEEQEVQ